MKGRHQRVPSLQRAAAVCAFSLGLIALPSAANAATTLAAVVNANGAKARAFPAGITSARTAVGEYKVLFSRNVSTCVFVSIVGSPNTVEPQGGGAKVWSLPGNPRGVVVQIGQSGVAADRPFHLVVVCP